MLPSGAGEVAVQRISYTAKDIFREGTVLKMGRLIAALGIADALDKQHYRLSM